MLQRGTIGWAAVDDIEQNYADCRLDKITMKCGFGYLHGESDGVGDETVDLSPTSWSSKIPLEGNALGGGIDAHESGLSSDFYAGACYLN
jgi:hypothetical protein